MSDITKFILVVASIIVVATVLVLLGVYFLGTGNFLTDVANTATTVSTMTSMILR